MALVVVVCLFGLLVSANGDCTARLHVDGDASPFEIRGVVAIQEPFEFASLAPLIDEQRVGVTGVLLLESDAECPTNVTSLDDFWKSLKLRTANRRPLQVYPNEVAGKVTSFGAILATVNFTGLELSWTANNFREWTDGGPGGFVADVNVSFMEGSVLRTGNRFADEVVKRDLTTSAERQVNGVLSVDRSYLRIEFNTTEFPFTQLARFKVESPRKEDTNLLEADTVLNYTVAGAISASTTLGCALDCGNNGRCMKLYSGKLGCQCACGWAGDACNISSGFCSAFPPPRFPECGNDRTELEATCACQEGWQGSSCNMCTTDAACAEFLNIPNGRCVDAFTYNVKSALKVYSCEQLSGENVLAPFFGQQLQIRCNTTGPSGQSTFFGVVGDVFDTFLPDDDEEDEEPTIDNSPFCEFDFHYDDNKEDTVFCVAWGCTFEGGSDRVQCKGPVECSCGGACSSTINDTVQTISSMNLDCSDGKDCKDCKEDQKTCLISLRVEELLNDLEATCRARECLDPNGETLVGN